MNRLCDLINKPSRTVLGLMSGTSHDGIDCAIARIKGSGIKSRVSLVYHRTYAYSASSRKLIETAFKGTTKDICSINFKLGELFADASLRCIRESGLKPADIDLIASHGQTVYHVPPSGKRQGSTLQIGEASIIAERTGVVTISDFRQRDMAAGGHGAPLVPLADYILFRRKGWGRAVQNIGGMANLTIVTDNIQEVIAFDTGPGNFLINEAVRIITGGKKGFDKDGKMASRGVVNGALLKELMNDPYFRKTPPKSTGIEMFGTDMVQKLITRLQPSDLIATLTRFTAATIFNAYERFILGNYKIDELIVCGGGSRNPVIMSHLKDLFREKSYKIGYEIKVVSIDEVGIPSSAKEALSFAILGNETISGNPGNLPQATGAGKGVILGKISM